MEFVQNNLLLFVVAFVSGAMLLWPLVRRSTGGPWVSPTQATQKINREDALPLDVREANEYAAGHILGAKNAPIGRIDAGTAELDKLKGRALIVYCDNGNRASKAMATLKRMGFTDVAQLSGGFGAWQQAGLPVERS